MRFILITEAHLVPDSVGYNKTAWVLIKNFSPESYDLYIPTNVKKEYKSPIDPTIKCKKYFLLNLFKPVRNRFGHIVNPYINFVNYLVRILSFKFKSRGSKADFVFVIPNTFELLHYAYLTAKRKGLPLRIFLMDDWFSQFKKEYQVATVKNSLLLADRFIFISSYLERSVFKRYDFRRSSTIFFNPPKKLIKNAPARPALNGSGSQVTRICYIGSIFPMHDSIFQLMQLINEYNSRNTNKIALTVFTGMYHQLNFAQYENEHILYGGFIKDSNLMETIRQYDMGLITTSFSQDSYIRDVVSTSLLTKLNDYITACLPILHFGPSYAACHDFIKQHKIGLCIADAAYPRYEQIMNNTLNNFEQIQTQYFRDRQQYLRSVDELCSPQNVFSFLNA